MRIHRLIRGDGQCVAFEVENVYIRPKTIAKLVSTIVGVSEIRVHWPFSSSDDVHVEFKYQGKDFIVWEPFGDNSRYWIGPKQEGEVINTTLLEHAFEKYQSPLILKIIGDLITLNFKSLCPQKKTKKDGGTH
jgi:hypothetical protein